MEQGLKEFASGVEQLVDRLVSTPILHKRHIKPLRAVCRSKA